MGASLGRASEGRPRVCIVSGSPHAGRCGIHDFALTLAGALQLEGVEVEVVDQRDWSTSGTLRLARCLRAIRPDIIHMQYPMIVGWRSVGPHALGFLSRIPQVVTLHEFSSFDRLRRASMLAFVASAVGLAITTRVETTFFLKSFPQARSKTTTIPIGSNVPLVPDFNRPRPQRTIAYFGQIKPLKGLEQFLELARIAAEAGKDWKFQVIGSPAQWAGDYLLRLQRRPVGAPIEWLLGGSDEETASALAAISAAYLPYPDGVSERRGSLIAALGNGAPVITTQGPYQPDDIGDSVLFASGPSEAAAVLNDLFGEPHLEQRLRRAGPHYVQKFSWNKIAKQYVEFYQAAVARSTLAEHVA
jgi:glycosyltransferase involved in cell wall biosynthesis